MQSVDGFRYYVLFLDDYSRFVWLYPLKQKSDTFAAFNHFLNIVQTQFGGRIKAVQSDNGGEYYRIHNLCSQLGIQSRYSCPYTSDQNGRAERKHRHITETGLTLLAQASMPLCYWWDAFMTAQSLINGLPTEVLCGKSPMELLLSKKLDFSSLKTFRCACYPCLRPYQQHKFQFHTDKCVYLGVSVHHKGHRCMNKAGRIFISRHVVFNEEEFPFGNDFGNSDSQQHPGNYGQSPSIT